MADPHVTQDVVETLSAPTSGTRVTQDAVEVLSLVPAPSRLSQYTVEVLTSIGIPSHITQYVVEVLTLIAITTPPVVFVNSVECCECGAVNSRGLGGVVGGPDTPVPPPVWTPTYPGSGEVPDVGDLALTEFWDS